MASGHRVNNVDFDDLFDPDITGDGPVALGYGRQDNGQRLRYAHIQYGSKGPDVGRRQGGVDISNLWARKGSAVYALGFNGKSYAAFSQAPTNATPPPTASLQLAINSDGTWTIRRIVSGGLSGNGNFIIDSGTWLPAGHAVSDYQVQFSGGASGGGTVTNSAPTPQSCTASHSIMLTASVPAASSGSMQAFVAAQCTMRRVSTGGTTNSTCSFSCDATGWF